MAAHTNLDKIEEQLEGLRLNFLLIYLLPSSIIWLLALLRVRFLGNNYEKELELKNENWQKK
tara:strand:- start:9850 stop:10035 length:186 start_codon:yes stop_codon:yes gene_type:complete